MAVLLVDDSPDDLRLVEFYLKSAGYEVVTANSGESALRYLAELSEGKHATPINLILLDVKMPGFDGLDACIRIKAMKQFEEVPILMVSVDTTSGTIQLAFRRGAVDYIRKPVIKAELLAKVAMVLKLTGTASPRTQTQKMMPQEGGMKETAQVPVSIDVLTGIMNWWRFDEIFELEWGHAAQEHSPISLIFFRLDDFKTFNDTYGYLMGDECLQKIAQTAHQICTQPGQVVARYRGAEFVVMLSGMGVEYAKSIAARIRETVETLDLGPTFALGVATAYPDEHTTRDTLLTSAKNALSHRT
jgi:diguanylate cyclase (GGDEF)-like protein